ncbi:MAG: sugar ABC transporter permease [Deltaproteobacteria bacterium]|nr:sugar ABC transporter permease [Deltaproteobacteria bacterium]
MTANITELIQNFVQENKGKIADSIRANFRTYTMIIALVLIWILFGILTDGVFFTPRNLSNLVRQMILIAILAIGMVPVIVTGNIDLSVGSVVGFISVIVAYCQFFIFPDILAGAFPAWQAQTTFMGVETSMNGVLSTFLSIIVALIVGLVVGLWQGSLIAYLRIPAFIVTLGGYLGFKGGILLVSGGRTIGPVENTLKSLGQGYVPKTLGLILAILVVACIFAITLYSRKQKFKYGFEKYPLSKDIFKAGVISSVVLFYVLYVANGYEGIQIPVLLMVIILLIFHYITNNTKFGRYIYALGGNQEATRLSGINTQKVVFKVFVLMGILCALCGVVLTGYVGMGTTTGGAYYELFTIAACVIGGTSLMGGEGAVAGAVVGALVIGSLNNGMDILGWTTSKQWVVQGLVLILAVFVDVQSKRKGKS